MTLNDIQYANLKETRRTNLAKEAETYRSNVAREQETHRSNVAAESNTATRNANDLLLGTMNVKELSRHNLATEFETNRHNLATESVADRQTSETVRHNYSTETLEARKQKETQRHNVVSESQEGMRIDENKRHNLATESQTDRNLTRLEQEYAETVRHNKRTEDINQLRADTEAMLSKVKAFAMTSEELRHVAEFTFDTLERWMEAMDLPITSQGRLNKARTTQTQIKTASDLFNMVTSIFGAYGFGF